MKSIFAEEYLCCHAIFIVVVAMSWSLFEWCFRLLCFNSSRVLCIKLKKHSGPCGKKLFRVSRVSAKRFADKSSHTICDLNGARNQKVWGSTLHGDSEFFLCPTLVTRRQNIFINVSVFKPTARDLGNSSYWNTKLAQHLFLALRRFDLNEDKLEQEYHN